MSLKTGIPPEEQESLRRLWEQAMSAVLGRPIVTKKAARMLGKTRYFNGRPCPKGHYSERLCSNSTCMMCVKQANASNPKTKRRAKEWAARHRSIHKERYRENHAKWRKANKGKMTAFARNRRARVKGAAGRHTAEEISDLYGKQHGKCANCFKRLAKKFHADHVVPLARGGANDIGNIQLLCPRCNVRKHAKDPIQWANEQGRLL